jgi:ketosteroid isomerase-like protein
MAESAEQVAQDFMRRYERAWREGAAAAAGLYTADAILLGQTLATRRGAIEKVLQAIIGQGWTSLAIELTHAQSAGEAVLATNRYTASGAGKSLAATASHVLVRAEGVWRSAMHTAR